MSRRRKQLLLVTPVEPAETGNGLAMRCGTMLRALSDIFDIHLYVVPMFPSPGARPEFTARYCIRTGRLDLAAHIDPLFKLISSLKDRSARERAMLDFPNPELSRFVTSRTGETIRDWYGATAPDALHVTRAYLAPLATAFRNRGIGPGPYCVLDMDEDEVLTRRRLADLYLEFGLTAAATRELAESKKYGTSAEQCLGNYDCVVLSSAEDSRRLHRRWPDVRFDVVPNAIVKQPVPRHRCLARRPPRLLFVGSLSYLPNEDAVSYLVKEVLPRLKRIVPEPVVVDIVGGGAGRRLTQMNDRTEVIFHGYVDRLDALYRQAQVAVVPIRGGGGTRLKILEAFHYGLPVVSTSIGAEGLNALNRRHLLIADNATRFADDCARLIQNKTLSNRLRRHATALLHSQYGLASVKEHLNVVYSNVL